MNVDDDLDQRLRQAGSEWRSANGIRSAGKREDELALAPTRRRRPILAMAASIIAVLAIVAGGLIWHHATGRNQTLAQSVTRSASPSPAPVDPSVLIRLRTIVAEMVKSNGGGAAVAEAVKTTHARAELLASGSTTNEAGNPDYSASPVWLIQVRGQFVCGACKVPPEAKMPAGAIMTLIVSTDSYDETDFGIGSSATLDLASLGPVVPLLDPAVLAELRSTAAAQVAANGGGSYTAEAVLVPRDLAPVVSAQSGSKPGNELVWLLQLRGNFKCTSACFTAPGATAQRGPVIIEALDTATYGVDAFSIGRTTPVNLIALGPVVKVVG